MPERKEHRGVAFLGELTLQRLCSAEDLSGITLRLFSRPDRYRKDFQVGGIEAGVKPDSRGKDYPSLAEDGNRRESLRQQ